MPFTINFSISCSLKIFCAFIYTTPNCTQLLKIRRYTPFYQPAKNNNMKELPRKKSIRLFTSKHCSRRIEQQISVAPPSIKYICLVLVRKTMSVDLHFKGFNLAQPISALPFECLPRGPFLNHSA
jgi:hypothetical protein